MAGKLWDIEELKAALALYCTTPFGKMHSKNKEIIELSRKLERTPGAVALKLVNFASLDTTIDRKGMGNVSKLDKKVWNEFFSTFISKLPTTTKEETGFAEAEEHKFNHENFPGLDISVTSTRRINQDFFRKLVLTSYNSKCAITGLTETELLIAGHIIPWSHNKEVRTDPRNGICLNHLFDRAFDRGLIAIDKDFSILYSDSLTTNTLQKMKNMAESKLNLPSRFRPSQEYFSYHRENIFRA